MPVVTFFDKKNQPMYAICDSGLVIFKPSINKPGNIIEDGTIRLLNSPVKIDGIDKKLTCGVNQYKLLIRMIDFCESSFEDASKEGFDFTEPFGFLKSKRKK